MHNCLIQQLKIKLTALMWDYDRLFQIIEELIMHHSPSGVEAEINQLLMQRFAALGVEVWCVACRRRHRADNIIAKIPGKNPDRAMSNDKPLRVYAITAHKDEIGAIVKNIGDEGRVEVRKLGGSFPWVYGEGVVDLLGDNETINGILSFGSNNPYAFLTRQAKHLNACCPERLS